MKVLITGGCSDIGISLSERLVLSGHEAIVYDNREVALPQHVDFTLGDVRDFDAVAQAAKNCTAGIHLASLADGASDSEILSVNVLGAFSFLLAAHQANFRNSIIASSTPVHLTKNEEEDSFPLRFSSGDDRLYDLTKIIQEMVGREFHSHQVPILCIRFGHVVLGKEQMNLKRTRQLSSEQYCRGGWVALEDIVSACAAGLMVEPSADTFEILNIVGAKSSREKFKVEEAEIRLGIKLEFDFAKYS